VDRTRDLARVEPWRESLEHSLARRGDFPRCSIEPRQLRGRRNPAHDEEPVRALPPYWLLCWQAIAKRWPTLAAGGAGVLTLILLAATRPSVSDGRRAHASATAAHVDAYRAARGSRSADAGHAAPGSGSAGVTGARTCQLVDNPIGYVNPLAGAAVTPKRIDQGVDYTGSGTLTAIGAATVTSIATSDTGWPGAFIEYQLLGGPESGCFVFYAEGVTPAEGLHVGETIRAGQAVAAIIPNYSSGIEIGWGADDGTKTYAAKMGEWSARAEQDNIPTAAGKSFSSLIASLGGPPGKVEG
jgi:hypothetical protein